MSITACFTDADGDEYAVKYDPHHWLVTIEGDGSDVVFRVIDGQKIIDGIKAAMLQAALGGDYGAGVQLVCDYCSVLQGQPHAGYCLTRTEAAAEQWSIA